MKKWRKEAVKHNKEAGKKHMGRVMKPNFIDMNKFPSVLFMRMLSNTGLIRSDTEKLANSAAPLM